MPYFSRDPNGPSRGRNPRPRPRPSGPGYAPQQRYDTGFNRDPRDRPAPRPQQRPAPRKPAGPARIEPRQPASGKQRRRMVKAAAWRLAQILHVRPAVVITTLATTPSLDRAFSRNAFIDRFGEAVRLAKKIVRLNKRGPNPTPAPPAPK